MTRLLTLVLLFVAGTVQAQNATYTWTPPTTNSDGSALPAAQIAGYNISCKFTPTDGTAGSCTLSKTSLAGGAATTDSLTATIPAVGGTLCVTLATRSTSGRVSGPSNEACKVFAAVDPNPPTNLRVVGININVAVSRTHSIAYLLDSLGRRSGTVAGFPVMGAKCTGAALFTYRGQSYHKFDTSRMVWWATAPTKDVAAPCA